VDLAAAAAVRADADAEGEGGDEDMFECDLLDIRRSSSTSMRVSSKAL
jgi:hypothetical protein